MVSMRFCGYDYDQQAELTPLQSVRLSPIVCVAVGASASSEIATFLEIQHWQPKIERKTKLQTTKTSNLGGLSHLDESFSFTSSSLFSLLLCLLPSLSVLRALSSLLGLPASLLESALSLPPSLSTLSSRRLSSLPRASRSSLEISDSDPEGSRTKLIMQTPEKYFFRNSKLTDIVLTSPSSDPYSLLYPSSQAVDSLFLLETSSLRRVFCSLSPPETFSRRLGV